MNKEKCIEVLNELSMDVEEWDEEYVDEIKVNIAAIDYAIDILKSSSVCGKVNINGEKYLVCKSE